MAELPELNSAWIIVSCSESYANDIEGLEINRKHIIVYESTVVDDREATPFGDEQRVYFGLRPRREPSYLFGTTGERDASVKSLNDTKVPRPVHFQLASAGARRRLRVSDPQFRLQFNHPGSWMLVDYSSNGTWVDEDLVASNKARGHAASRDIPIESNYRRIALHPEKWNLITAGKLQFQIKVGKATPPSFFPDYSELDFDDFRLQSNPTSSSALVPSTLIQPAFVDHVQSRKFHEVESYISKSSGTKLLVDKSTGERLIGEVYDTSQAGAAQRRYKALFEILKEGREKNLIPFLGSMDGDGYMILSEYCQATSLSERIEGELTPLPLELSFILAQIIQAVAYLHSRGIMHRNIRPGAILVARGTPVASRLTGFSEAISAATAIEEVGHSDFRAPEMSGNQEYDQLVDVFSLSKVIEHCLAIQDISNTLIDPIFRKGLAADPSERFTASRIHQEICSLADNDYVWPFQSLTLKRRFRLAWCREDNDTYVRLSDLCQVIKGLADPYSADVSLSAVKTKYIDDQNFPGNYCLLKYGKRLMDDCRLHLHTGILDPRSSGHGVFSTHVDLNFDLYYHTASQMFNVTTLLKTVSLDLARVATWDLKPQIQEVHGDVGWEGNYIDRQSFEKVLERVRKNEIALVFPDLLGLNDQRTQNRFSAVDYSKTVIVVTRWLTPPWVLLSRETDRTPGTPSYGSLNDLKDWCLAHGLHSIADRIDLTIRNYPIPQDWKSTRVIDLPHDHDDNAISILSTHSSTSFRFGNRGIRATTGRSVSYKSREDLGVTRDYDTSQAASENESQDQDSGRPARLSLAESRLKFSHMPPQKRLRFG